MTATKKTNSEANKPQSISQEEALEYKEKVAALEAEIEEYVQICKEKDEKMVEYKDRIKELEEDMEEYKSIHSETLEYVTTIGQKEDEIAELKLKNDELTELLEQTKASSKAEGPTFEIEKKGKNDTVDILTIEVAVANLNIKSMGVITAQEFVDSAGKGVAAAKQALDLMLKNNSSALRVIARRKKTAKAKKGGQ